MHPTRFVRLAFAFALAAASSQLDAQGRPIGTARFETRVSLAGARWWKGNTHSHTTNSDGDTAPEEVARWYRTHGYQFLVLSDHNVFTDPAKLASLIDSTFLLLPGEEVTSGFQKAAVHVNALAISALIPAPPRDSTLLGTVQRSVDAIRAVGAIPHINHPNFLWSIDSTTLFRVRNDRLFEIFNGHPLVHNLGGGDWPGMEEVWDGLLSGGRRMYGIAVDDAHTFQGEFTAELANPGRGWVVVRSPSLETRSLVTALEAGDFYASTGVVLDSVSNTATTLSVRIRQKTNYKYTTQFIGAGGRVLATDRTLSPRYTLRGSERYVRAKIADSGGAVAWVQPVFTSRFRAAAP